MCEVLWPWLRYKYFSIGTYWKSANKNKSLKYWKYTFMCYEIWVRDSFSQVAPSNFDAADQSLP